MNARKSMPTLSNPDAKVKSILAAIEAAKPKFCETARQYSGMNGFTLSAFKDSIVEFYAGFNSSNAPQLLYLKKNPLTGIETWWHNPKSGYSPSFSPIEVSLEKAAEIKALIEKEISFKKWFYAQTDVPYEMRYTYYHAIQNPAEYPVKTGTGRISGCTNMGSCQCGDVDWWIEYDCDKLEFSFGNSNWSNRSDFHIPYSGNALQMVIRETNIFKRWKCV